MSGPEQAPATHGGAAGPAEEDWTASAPRRELKYLGAGARAGPLAALLASTCLPDPRHPENTVHSVYFDTRRLAAWADKAAGQYRKEKVRLRWYEPGDGHAWLEIKRKTGSRGWKHRKRIAFRPPAAGAGEEDFARVAREHLATALRPSCWLSYRRLRLVTPDGGARVALDRDVRLEWLSPAIARRRGARLLPFFVLEVKGESPQAPGWLDRVIGRFARRAAVSKYALCIDHARGGLH